MEHRLIRSKSARNDMKIEFKDDQDFNEFDLMTPTSSSTLSIATESPKTSDKSQTFVLPEIHHIPRPPRKLQCQPTNLPNFLYGLAPKVQCNGKMM